MYNFTTDCLTGINEIDEEHRQLFKMIRETHELVSNGGCSAAAARNLVTTLREYALNHFAHEEAYMEKIHDCELERQKKEHNKFRAKLDQYDLEKITDENDAKVVSELLEYVTRWLYGHIIGSDLMIGKNCEPADREDRFAFKKEYMTGNEMIDTEHKRLFEIIAETDKLIHDEQFLHDKYDRIVDILSELKDYTVFHFNDEEKYMEKIQYEGLDAQKRAHQIFVNRLEEVDLESVDDNQEEYLEELIAFLLNWLTQHILKVDKLIP
jgi:hemerythrin